MKYLAMALASAASVAGAVINQALNDNAGLSVTILILGLFATVGISSTE